MELYGDQWARKGATLSDKTAQAEFGLRQDEIIAAIRARKLQYRPAAIHGNPWLPVPLKTGTAPAGSPASLLGRTNFGRPIFTERPVVPAPGPRRPLDRPGCRPVGRRGAR
jgi:hypothetical protein